MNAERVKLARCAVLRVLLTERAFGRLRFDSIHIDALADALVYALLPLLAVADQELGGESHGARRTGGLA